MPSSEEEWYQEDFDDPGKGRGDFDEDDCCSFLGKDRRVRTLLAWSITFLLVSVVLITFSWVFAFVLWEEAYNKSIEGQIIVDSPSSANYKTFLSSEADPTLPPFYELWYFFNVTNEEEVIVRGAKPVVVEVGPYVYTQVKKKLNVTFLEDGNVVGYRECEAWIYDAEMTEEYGCVNPITGLGCDPDLDRIHNLNPGYLGAVANAGSELLVVQGFAGPSTAKIFAFLQTIFLDDMVSRWAALHVLPNKQSALGGDTPGFYEVWANATSPPSEQWEDMIVSQGSEIPSGIAMASARALFDSEHPDSLTNSSQAAYQLWASLAGRSAFGGVHTDSNDDARERENENDLNRIQREFHLTREQAEMVVGWLAMHLYPGLAEPALVEHHKVKKASDLAYLQWGEATVSPGGRSIQELYPAQQFPSKPEFHLWSRRLASMHYDNAEKLLAGRFGLFEALNWAVFAGYAGAPVNVTVLDEVWGIESAEQLRWVELYFANIADKYAQPEMQELAVRGGGLFTSRTPNQMAWHVMDPLLEVLLPAAADVALQPNITDATTCIQQVPIDYFYTGKNNTQMVGQSITFKGFEVLPTSWYGTSGIRVNGSNSEGQFAPALQPGALLTVFDSNFYRQLLLEQVSNVTLRGVDAYRYTLSWDNFAVPQPRYAMQDGFQGLVNVSGPQQGAPIYLSQAHWLGVEKSWTKKVRGMPSPNMDADPTFVDVEPYTGTAIRTWQALQVNMYVPDKPDWFAYSPFGHENMPRDIMFPIAIIRQYSELNEDNAKEIKDSLYLGFALQKILFGAFWGLGLLLLAIGITLAYFSYRRWLSAKSEPLATFLDPIAFGEDVEHEALLSTPYSIPEEESE